MSSDSEQVQELQARIAQLEQTLFELRVNEAEQKVYPQINIEEIRLAINNLSDFISIISPEAEILYINRAMDNRPQQEVIGTSLYDYALPDERHILDESLSRAIENKTSVSYEFGTVFDDAKYWFLTRLIPIIKDDNVTKLIAISTDNTEQHKTFQDLVISQARFSALFNNTPLAAIVWDENFKTIEWNPAAERIFEWQREEALGRDFADLIVAENERNHRRELFSSALDSNQSYKYLPAENITKSGRTIQCQWWGTTLCDTDGNAIGIASFAEDVTEKQAAKRALTLAKQQAEENARAKSIFLANMSHEIRTPMNGIMGLVDLLMRSDLPTEEKENLKLIKQSTNNLLSIVNEILDFSKIESGSIHIESVATDISALLSEVYSLMKPLAEEKNLQFNLKIDLSDSNFLTDPVRIKQIVSNLLSNALKFTESGSVDIHCSSRPKTKYEANLKIEVRDTGIGIPKEKLSMIFEDFYQGDESITRRFGGTGLGLTISASLANLMGGNIMVTSEPNRGSTFTLSLPVEYSTMPSLSSENTTSTPIRHYKKCVLLVDDNPVNLLVGKKLLQAMDIEVLTAENGVQAIDTLKSSAHVDLVLLDMQMPIMDGVTATQEIRALGDKYQSIPIIAVTANVLPEERQRCKEAGMNGFLAKPFSFSQLTESLDPWFAENRD